MENALTLLKKIAKEVQYSVIITDIQAKYGFGNLLYPMRWIMLISGLYLIYKVWIKRKNCIK